MRTPLFLLAAAAAAAFGALLAGRAPRPSRGPAPPAAEATVPARPVPAPPRSPAPPGPPPRTPWEGVPGREYVPLLAGVPSLAVGSPRPASGAGPESKPDPAEELERAWRRIRGDYGSAPDLWAGNRGGGDLSDLAALFPRSALAASFDEYAAIRGGTYHGYEYVALPSDAKYRPEAEIPGFTAWVERYPGHPGQDDASFRLGRCFGIVGNGLEAVRWFRRAQAVPDGDMADDARAWETLWLDLLLPDDGLRALADSGDPAGAYSWGVRLLRRGDFRSARAALRAGAGGLEEWTGQAVLRQVSGAEEMEELSREVAAASPAELDRALYARGRGQYHDPWLYENVLWRSTTLGNRSGTLLVQGVLELCGHGGAPAAFREEAERGDARLRAREDFLRIARDRPGSPLAGKARFSAATALAHTLGDNAERAVVRCPREVRIRVAREYLAVARDCPGESFADDALYYAGIFSGDRSCFETVLGRYPGGDMAAAAAARLREVPRVPARLDEVPGLIGKLRSGPRHEDPRTARSAAERLELILGFCVGRILALPDDAADAAVEELSGWFARARGWLEFDPSAGAWLIP